MKKPVDIIMIGVSGTHRKIWDFVSHQVEEGATTDEIAYSLKLEPKIVATRVWEMVVRKRLVNSGKKRDTRKGRKAIIWYALPPKATDREQLRIAID